MDPGTLCCEFWGDQNKYLFLGKCQAEVENLQSPLPPLQQVVLLARQPSEALRLCWQLLAVNKRRQETCPGSNSSSHGEFCPSEEHHLF